MDDMFPHCYKHIQCSAFLNHIYTIMLQKIHHHSTKYEFVHFLSVSIVFVKNDIAHLVE